MLMRGQKIRTRFRNVHDRNEPPQNTFATHQLFRFEKKISNSPQKFLGTRFSLRSVIFSNRVVIPYLNFLNNYLSKYTRPGISGVLEGHLNF